MFQDRCNLVARSDQAGLVHLIDEAGFSALADTDPQMAALGRLQDFSGQAGRLMTRLDGQGTAEAWFGLGRSTGRVTAMRTLAGRLPPGDWSLAAPPPWPMDAVARAFALGGYGFDRYKSRPGPGLARLVTGEPTDGAWQIAQACALARDLINTPASDMGPADLEAVVKSLGGK